MPRVARPITFPSIRMSKPLRRSALLLTLVLAASGCKPEAPPLPEIDGLAVHQTVVLAHAGAPGERRIEVLEDARITPALRYWLWGGSKDPDDFLHHPGTSGDRDLAAAMARGPLLRGLVRLVDHNGNVLD